MDKELIQLSKINSGFWGFGVLGFWGFGRLSSLN